MGQGEKGRIIGGLDGTDDADSLDCGADGGFDGGYDGGSDGFESKQRRENCKRRSRGYQAKMPEWETMPWINSDADGSFAGGYDGGSGGFNGGFDGFDGGFEGLGGGCDGLDGFDGGAVGVAESLMVAELQRGDE